MKRTRDDAQDSPPVELDVKERRRRHRVWRRAAKRNFQIAAAVGAIVAIGIWVAMANLLGWSTAVTVPLTVLVFFVVFIGVSLVLMPEAPDWPPRRPEYDAPPEPVGKWSRLVYEVGGKAWRDMEAKRRERRRLRRKPPS